MLSFDDWPMEDQRRWERAFISGDRFDETGAGAHLAPATRKARRESYGRFLGFLEAVHPRRLTFRPEQRVSPAIVTEYVRWRGSSCRQSAMAADLGMLRDSLKLLCPDADWSWLLAITKRLAVAAPRNRGRYHLVTSEPSLSTGHPAHG
jgi:hypothetical protein